MLYRIRVTIEDPKNHKKTNGILTNWDEDSCFVRCDENVNFKGHVNLTIHFSEHDFKQDSMIVTTAKKINGIGLKFIKNEASEKNWMDIYDIMTDRGLNVEYLK